MNGPSLAQALSTGYGVERQFCCPVHGDNSPSASVNTLKMVWVCYACGAHGKVGGEILAQDVDVEQFRRHLFSKNMIVSTKPESWLNVYDSPHPYWYSRFSREAVEHFRLGHDYEHDAATYPLRDTSGAVLGVVLRSLGEGQRYHYPYGVDVGDLLFNYHDIEHRVLAITEGATDAIAGWETDLPISFTAVYGSRFSARQALLVRRLDPTIIVVASDQDAAGWGLYSRILAMLPEYRVDRVTWEPSQGKDLASLDVEKRREILASRLELYGPRY